MSGPLRLRLKVAESCREKGKSRVCLFRPLLAASGIFQPQTDIFRPLPVSFSHMGTFFWLHGGFSSWVWLQGWKQEPISAEEAVASHKIKVGVLKIHDAGMAVFPPVVADKEAFRFQVGKG